MWEVTSKATEDWFDAYIGQIISSETPKLPPHEGALGHTDWLWYSPEPGHYYIQTEGGTIADRISTHDYIEKQLEAFGLQKMAVSWTGDDREQVQQKALRLIRTNKVQIHDNMPNYISGTVIGDTEGTHQVEIQRDPNVSPRSQAGLISGHCDCSWGTFQNQPRTRQWKQYQNAPCLREDAMIMLADGSYLPISEMQIGMKVYTHDGIGTVSQVMQRHYRGDLLSLKTWGSNIPLILTPEHEVWAYGTPQRLRKPWQENGNGFMIHDDSFLFDIDPEWIEPKDLKTHDWLTSRIADNTHGGPLDFTSIIPLDWEYEEKDGMIQRFYMKNAQRKGQKSYTSKHFYQGSLPRYINPSPALMCVLGLFVAEGVTGVLSHNHPGNIEWTFNINERDTIVKTLIDSIRELGITEHIGIYDRTGGNSLSVRITHHPLALLLHVLAGKYANGKQWHPWIMTLSPTDQQILLDWHREGDGNESINKRTWCIDTVSEQLALQTVDMLRRCNKLPSINHTRQKGGPTNRDKECWIYRVSWIEEPLQSTSGQRRDFNRMFTSTKIHTIDTIPHDGQVYNLSVYPQESYVADGKIVHNCAHQMALWWLAQSMPLDTGDQDNPNQQLLQQGQGDMSQFSPLKNNPIQNFAPDMPGPNIPGLTPRPDTGTTQQTFGPDEAQGFSPGNPESALPQAPPEPLDIDPNGSVPGKKPQSPANPIQYPGGTFSSIREAADMFNEGDMVQLKNDDWGTGVGDEGYAGVGQPIQIPKGTIGEVRGVHAPTGMCEVFYNQGPFLQNGKQTAMGATAWHLPSEIHARPDLRGSSPMIKRT